MKHYKAILLLAAAVSTALGAASTGGSGSGLAPCLWGNGKTICHAGGKDGTTTPDAPLGHDDLLR